MGVLRPKKSVETHFLVVEIHFKGVETHFGRAEIHFEGVEKGTL